MRIAFITDEIPRPNRAGYLAYNHALVSVLADRGHDVLIVLGWPRLSAPVVPFGGNFARGRVRVAGTGVTSVGGYAMLTRPRRQARALARSVLEMLPGRVGERLRRQGRSVAYGMVDAVLGRFLTDAEAAAAAALAAPADLVIADTIFRAPALRFLPPGKPTAIVTHDVFSARHAALGELGLEVYPPSLSEADEAALLGPAGLVVAIQEQEQRLLRRLAPGAVHVTAPMPASPVPRPASIRRQPGQLAFVGSLAPHNADGMRWFIAEVWPLLRQRLPGVRLDVCGTVGRAFSSVPDGVTLHGVVRNLSPLLHRACLAIAPVRAGSGQATKLLDFAAHGLTTVTSSQGLAGYTRQDHWPFAVADTAEAFAEETARLAATDGTGREHDALAFLHRYEPGELLRPFVEAVEQLPSRQLQSA